MGSLRNFKSTNNDIESQAEELCNVALKIALEKGFALRKSFLGTVWYSYYFAPISVETQRFDLYFDLLVDFKRHRYAIYYPHDDCYLDTIKTSRWEGSQTLLEVFRQVRTHCGLSEE
jgi:hypothetical protein